MGGDSSRTCCYLSCLPNVANGARAAGLLTEPIAGPMRLADAAYVDAAETGLSADAVKLNTHAARATVCASGVNGGELWW